MKKLIGILLFVSLSLSAAPVISVVQFKNKIEKSSGNCMNYQSVSLGQLRIELERNLSKRGIRVVERHNLNKIYKGEFEHPNLDDSTKSKRKKFIAARYTISGELTEAAFCETRSSSGISIGGLISRVSGVDVDLDLKRRKVSGSFKIAAKLISVETGEIVGTFEGNNSVTDSKFSGNVGIFGVGVDADKSTNKAIEKHVNLAIKDLAEKISSKIMTL
jgi:curli biogenesis system outer membrane secretion channel CsgG